MGARRYGNRKNWPSNLFARTVDGVTYYTYRDPDTRKETGLGRDFQGACEAVRIVNRKRAPNAIQSLVSRIENPACQWGEFLDEYDRDRLAKLGLAKDTLYERRLLLKRVRAWFGAETDIQAIGLARIAEKLDEVPAQTSNRIRSLLVDVFAEAASKGKVTSNPASLTRPKLFKVARQRLTLEQFKSIREASEPWLQRAMDLALWSLQRREDLVNMVESDWKDGRLSVRQRKVEKHGLGLLRIKPGPKLKRAITAAINAPDRAGCRYLIFREPDKSPVKKGDPERARVTGEYVSKSFASVRDSLPAFEAVPAESRPSWHEIRALGADQYRLMKWPDAKIQALLGHSKIDMTLHYLGGHEPKWQDVDAA